MLELKKPRKQAVGLTLPQEQLECLRYWADRMTVETGQYVSMSQVVSALVSAHEDYPAMLKMFSNSKYGKEQQCNG